MKSVLSRLGSKQALTMRHLWLIAIVCGVLGGFAAICMVVLMAWLCQRSWVIDQADTHGISENQSSRLGGVVVFFGTAAFFATSEFLALLGNLSLAGASTLSDYTPTYFVYAGLIALVGLWDDFVTRTRPAIRLLLVFLVSIYALSSDAVTMSVNAFDWLPLGLNNSIALVALGTLVVAGFVNAGNMADGANGLLSLIAVSFFSVLMVYDGVGFEALIIMALIIFLIFNVLTGRIFLGDFGAYGLSALIAFGSLELYSNGDVAASFLACLLSYPCIEMIRVVIVRAQRGNSPFQASNDHLHNYLYESLRNGQWNALKANSVTGCSIGFVSAGLPALLAISEIESVANTTFWASYFLIYLILHFCLAARLERMIHA